jgi:uroporphyrinogen-III synthase
MAALSGLKILVPESRELDLFATMLENEGAQALRCPLVQILDLEDSVDADAWIDRCIAGAFDDLVLLTGEGLRRLLALSKARQGALVAALGRLPDPATGRSRAGLAPAWARA